MWFEARGNVMRKEFEDLVTRIRNANQWARAGIFNNIDQTIDRMAELYEPASNSERMAILKETRKSASAMWIREIGRPLWGWRSPALTSKVGSSPARMPHMSELRLIGLSVKLNRL
jgi:hypothetical protein